MFFSCLACKKVSPLVVAEKATCPLCGSANGETIDAKRVKEGMEAGAYFNLDPKTGKRVKRPRR